MEFEPRELRDDRAHEANSSEASAIGVGDYHSDSAVAELVKRANAKRVTLCDYIIPVCLRYHPK